MPDPIHPNSASERRILSSLVLGYTVNLMRGRLIWIPLLVAFCGCSGGNRPAVERAVNSVTGPRSVSRPRWEGPDPSFMNLKWGPMMLAPGATGTVEFDVINRGEKPFGPFRAAVYGNLGTVVTGKKTLLGSADVAPLEGGPRRVVITFTAPQPAGYYALDVELDDQRQVPGDDTTNNRSAPERLIVK